CLCGDLCGAEGCRSVASGANSVPPSRAASSAARRLDLVFLCSHYLTVRTLRYANGDAGRSSNTTKRTGAKAGTTKRRAAKERGRSRPRKARERTPGIGNED